MVIEPLLEHVGPFFLVFARFTGLFVFAPILGSGVVPVRAKALAATAMAFAVYPLAPAWSQTPVPTDLFGLAPLLISEVLIGLLIGLLATLPLVALQMGGQLMGYQMGLSLAQSYNPDFETNLDVIGQILFLLSLSIFAAVGGLDALFLSLVNTLERVPPGGFEAGWTPVELIVGLLASGFELAIRVATPVLGITLVAMMAMGFIMKSMPQVNVLSIGFALKILLGVFMLAFSIAAIGDAGASWVEATLESVVRWSRSPEASGGQGLEILERARASRGGG